MAAVRQALDAETDAVGRKFEVIELPPLPTEPFDGIEVGVAYANIYLINGAVIVGTGDFASDTAAVEVLQRAFVGREVFAVPGRMFSYAGGGPYCTTMQVPAPGGTP